MENTQKQKNPATTKTLKTQLFTALKTIDRKKVRQVFKDHHLDQHSQVVEFLENLKPAFETWQKPGQESRLRDEVTTGDSRCHGCEFGKDVTRFTFRFQHTKAKGIDKQIIYARSFAVLFTTKNDCFSSIGVCNAFLSENEMNDLNAKNWDFE